MLEQKLAFKGRGKKHVKHNPNYGRPRIREI